MLQQLSLPRKETPMSEWIYPFRAEGETFRYLALRANGVYYYKRSVNGGVDKHSYDTTDAAEAKRLHVERFGQADGFTVERKRKITGQQAFDEWLVRLDERDRTSNTKERYLCSWNMDARELLGPTLVHILEVLRRAKTRPKLKQAKIGTPGAFRLTDDPADRRWYVETDKTLSKAAVKRVHAMLASLLEFCIEPAQLYALKNVAKGLGGDTPPTPKPSKLGDDVVFSELEIDRIAKAVGTATPNQPRAGAEQGTVRGDWVIAAFKRFVLVHLLAETGVRIAEAMALEISDIWFKTQEINIDKQLADDRSTTDRSSWFAPLKGREDTIGERPRLIPLGEGLEELLREYVRRGMDEGWLHFGGLLFPSSTGCYGGYSDIAEHLREEGSQAAGKPVTAHMFRHTYASNK